MEHIFKLVGSDKDTEDAIWKHLLFLSAMLDPDANAREVLQKSVGGSEGNFLADIMSKVEGQIDPNATNPMEVVTSIMKSGVFTEMMSNMNSGMENGSLDLGKMLGMVQGLMSSLQQKGGGSGGEGCENGVGCAPPGGGIDGMNMITSLIGALGANTGAGAGGTPGAPDLSKIMGAVVSGLSQSGAAGGAGPGGDGNGAQADINNIISAVMSNLGEAAVAASPSTAPDSAPTSVSAPAPPVFIEEIDE